MNEKKMVLEEVAAAEVQKAYSAVVGEFLDPEKQQSNVVGLASGIKWKNGQPTGEPALLVLVTHKVDKNQLSSNELVPTKLADMQTDVLAIGYPYAGESSPMNVGIQTLAKRIRPAEGGYSVGHYKITAGTIATCVYDTLPGQGDNKPRQGIGVPRAYYILSNNHVLADCNAASLGDPILQPGPYDGGSLPGDHIANLSRFIPITFEPPVPRFLHNNIVDAAIAKGEFHDLDREIYWIGYMRGWRQKANVRVGTIVQKTGRTTNYTIGRITATNATVDVGYGSGRTARFRDQIMTTNMSAPGDSGSLITTLDDIAVGLLFAGSDVVTIANQIENVRSLLNIEVAEQVM